MLSKRAIPCHSANLRAKQRGVVLLVTLIVLVIMTLTAIALVRSMDTTNVIAGNLAFQQSATHSGDAGVEAAIAWMEPNVATFASNSFANGYSASISNPVAGQSWDAFFTLLVNNNRTVTLPTDAVGNTVTYAIERLCLSPGSPTAHDSYCTVTPAVGVSTASSEDAGTIKLTASTQQYYRITSRTVGPRNSKSYVQAVVAM
jgi:Tfp pilus assembly protein PilX